MGIGLQVFACLLSLGVGAAISRLYFRRAAAVVFNCSCGTGIILECPKWPKTKTVSAYCQECGKAFDLFWSGSRFNILGESKSREQFNDESKVRDLLANGVPFPKEILDKYFSPPHILPNLPIPSDGGDFAEYLYGKNAGKKEIDGTVGSHKSGADEAAEELRNLAKKREAEEK